MDSRQEGGARLAHGRRYREQDLPLVSVITATFNAGELLKDTLLSIRTQRYPNIEWIVIDGGSTDETLDLLRANDDVIDYWLSESDHGLYDALGKGFALSNGGVLCWLGAGDIFLPGALATVTEVFAQHPEINWITGMNFAHLPGGKIVRCSIPPAYSSELIRCGKYGKSLPFIQQESTFFRRSMLKHADTNQFKAFKLAGDLYLWCCFSKHERLTVVYAGLGSFCVHDGQLSEDMHAYWLEADTFLERSTVFLWGKTMMCKLWRHAPLPLKILTAGNGMLIWLKRKGWV